jgi:hypothetical protein
VTRVPLLLLFVSNFLYRDPTRHTFVLNQALAHLEMSFITISTHSSSMLMPIRVRPFLFVLEMHRRLILEQPTLCVESNEPTQWKRLHLSTANFIRYLMVLVKVQARTGYAVIERRTAIARGNQLGSFTWERNNTMKRIMRLLGKPTTCNNSNMALRRGRWSGACFVRRLFFHFKHGDNEQHLQYRIYILVFPFFD